MLDRPVITTMSHWMNQLIMPKNILSPWKTKIMGKLLCLLCFILFFVFNFYCFCGWLHVLSCYCYYGCKQVDQTLSSEGDEQAKIIPTTVDVPDLLLVTRIAERFRRSYEDAILYTYHSPYAKHIPQFMM